MSIRLHTLVLGILGFGAIALASNTGTKTLKAVSINAAVTSIEQSVSSFLVDKEKLLIFPSGRNFWVTVPFHSEKEKREERFETLLSQKRVQSGIEKFDGKRFFPIAIERGYLLYDGTENQMIHLSKTLKSVSPERSVAYDIIKPAADHKGEPTWVEIQKLQNRFNANYADEKGEKFTGITPIPFAWVREQFGWSKSKVGGNTEPRTFLVLSKIRGFLLNLLSCSDEFPSQCVLERACLAGGLPSDFDPRGLTIVKDTKLVLVGDAKKNRIGVFKFNSCFDVPLVETIAMPPQIKQLTDIQVDDSGRLWVSSMQPDDYFDSSLFVWEAREW